MGVQFPTVPGHEVIGKVRWRESQYVGGKGQVLFPRVPPHEACIFMQVRMYRILGSQTSLLSKPQVCRFNSMLYYRTIGLSDTDDNTVLYLIGLTGRRSGRPHP